MSLHLFDLAAEPSFGVNIAAALGISLSPHEERSFEDGEHKARPLTSVRGGDVYVLDSLYGDTTRSVNDKLCRFLFFLGTVRDAGAARTTAIVPYLCYARKDRRTQPRDPVNTRYVASLMEAVGIDAVLTMDVHNVAAYQNAFRCRTEHLEARRLFVDYFAGQLRSEPVAVVAPDAGGAKRADAFRTSLAHVLERPVDLVFMEKRRSEGVVSGAAVVGDVAGRVTIVVDDLVSSGTTLSRAARACRAMGATRTFAAATHGLFTADATAALVEPGLERLVVVNTVPPFRLAAAVVRDRLTVLDAAPLFAEAIRRLHTDGSIVELLAD